MDDRPIGIFDSGIGGLTVLRALHNRLPSESTIYFGDLARCPYGTRPHAEVRQFALQIGDYLNAQGIKLLVIACNTATAAAFDVLKHRYAIPVVGVIGPGAREAVRRSKYGRIGVAATDATVASGAYRSAILRLCPEAEVIERSASWLVPLVERGPRALWCAAKRLAPMLADMGDAGIDTLILGCTHFPLVRDLFEEAIGPDIAVVDSAETTAREVATLLTDLDIPGSAGTRRLVVTGSARAFADRAAVMFHSVPNVETVTLS